MHWPCVSSDHLLERNCIHIYLITFYHCIIYFCVFVFPQISWRRGFTFTMVAILTNDFMFVILGAEVCVDEKFCTDHVFPHIMCLRGVVFTLVAFSLILRCHTVSILDPINYLGPPAEVCVGGKCCHRALAMCHLIPHISFSSF